MPCCLTPSTTAREDFTGKTGCLVTVKLKGPSDAGAEIVHIRYDSDPIDPEPPFQFTVKTDPKMLVVLVEASKPGALLQLIESCDGGTEQVLDRFHYDPMNPARGYIIRGLSS
jgi:hypothetical protein